MPRTGTLATMVMLVVTVFATGPAQADAIDGTWCRADGRYLTIDGPKILTPGGTRMKGRYDRHGFDYVAPPGDPAPGKKITMNLITDDTASVRTGAATAPEVIWHRCKVPHIS